MLFVRPLIPASNPPRAVVSKVILAPEAFVMISVATFDEAVTPAGKPTAALIAAAYIAATPAAEVPSGIFPILTVTPAIEKS